MRFNLECVSPLKKPPKANKAIEALFLFVRHGARAPVDPWALPNETGTWVCDDDNAIASRVQISGKSNYRRYHTVYDKEKIQFPPSCQSSELLTLGMQQHYELGKFYHEYLIDDLKLLPENLDPETLYLRTSNPDRCLRSLESFITGLYDVKYSYETLKVITGQKPLEPLHPNPYGCRDVADAYYNKFLKTEEYAKRRDHALQVQKPLYDYLGLKADNENWMWLGDWMYSFVCSDQPVPEIVSEEMFELAMNDTAYYSGGLFEAFPDESSGSIWRLLFDRTDAIISGAERTKFALYSAHDTTLMALLSKLGYYFRTGIPPYRSHLSFELYKDGTVRVVYNGDVVSVKGEEFISLSNLKFLVQDSLSKCMD